MLYMEKLTYDMVTELCKTTVIIYAVELGFHKLKKEDIGEHVYFTQACKSIRNYFAIRHLEEVGTDAQTAWRIIILWMWDRSPKMGCSFLGEHHQGRASGIDRAWSFARAFTSRRRYSGERVLPRFFWVCFCGSHVLCARTERFSKCGCGF